MVSKIKVNGLSSLKPTVLMAHYDVVPVVEEAWEHDPFLGEVIDDKLYGVTEAYLQKGTTLRSIANKTP